MISALRDSRTSMNTGLVATALIFSTTAVTDVWLSPDEWIDESLWMPAFMALLFSHYLILRAYTSQNKLDFGNLLFDKRTQTTWASFFFGLSATAALYQWDYYELFNLDGFIPFVWGGTYALILISLGQTVFPYLLPAGASLLIVSALYVYIYSVPPLMILNNHAAQSFAAYPDGWIGFFISATCLFALMTSWTSSPSNNKSEKTSTDSE